MNHELYTIDLVERLAQLIAWQQIIESMVWTKRRLNTTQSRKLVQLLFIRPLLAHIIWIQSTLSFDVFLYLVWFFLFVGKNAVIHKCAMRASRSYIRLLTVFDVSWMPNKNPSINIIVHTTEATNVSFVTLGRVTRNRPKITFLFLCTQHCPHSVYLSLASIVFSSLIPSIIPIMRIYIVIIQFQLILNSVCIEHLIVACIYLYLCVVLVCRTSCVCSRFAWVIDPSGQLARCRRLLGNQCVYATNWTAIYCLAFVCIIGSFLFCPAITN